MIPRTIAIVADCDETLAPDTTAQLLEMFGVKAPEFYRDDCGRLVDAGWDPPLAYMSQILARLPKLTKSDIEAAGAKLVFYPGIPDIFVELEKEINETYYEDGIRLKEFVITGGIVDLIQASTLGKVVDAIWGCNFAYAEDGTITAIKNVVSFTEKTRFLYNIQKGLTGPEYRKDPYAVNMKMKPEEREVPFRNMIYLGDGPSDVPCMSIIDAQGEGWGHAIGILSDEKPFKTWVLGHARRAQIYVPPDYTRVAKWAWNQIHEAVVQIARRIKTEIQRGRDVPYPKY